MQTVIETPAYLASAKEEGVTEREREDIVSFIAANPDTGDLIPGTGGARKVRVAGRGKGKSGGYRVVTFYHNSSMPVFLFDIYGKDSQEDLSQADKNELRKILTELPKAWAEMVSNNIRKVGRRR